MCQPYSKLKLRCAFKADWPDWDIDEDSFSRWADLDIDCPLLVTMMKEHETDLIERGDFDPDEWGTDETTLFDGVHLHIDGGHIVYHQPDWGADIEFTNVPKTIGEAFDNFIDTFWEDFPIRIRTSLRSSYVTPRTSSSRIRTASHGRMAIALGNRMQRS